MLRATQELRQARTKELAVFGLQRDPADCCDNNSNLQQQQQQQQQQCLDVRWR
jgi:hypothetical protein